MKHAPMMMVGMMAEMQSFPGDTPPLKNLPRTD